MTKIDANKCYSTLLGWTPEDFGGIDFDDQLIAMISAQQSFLGVTTDGVAGPGTYGALLGHRQGLLAAQKRDLIIAGRIAVLEAERGWLKDIVDLPAKTSPNYENSRSYIDDTIRTMVGINWTWQPPYIADTDGHGNFEWCGAFACRGWRAAGLLPAIAKAFWASTYRLDSWARYQAIDEHTPNPKPAQGPYRMIVNLDQFSRPADAKFPDGTSPREGDILMVGGIGTGYGKHITLVKSFDSSTGVFSTIEGNGGGYGPKGNRRQGVVHAQRPTGLVLGMPPTTYFARRLIRPALTDLLLPSSSV